jgi:hypothetical protein
VIDGGYYIKARCIQNSDISFAPPHVREIWDWLIKESNHKDTKICLRGQCIRTYKDIINGLSWMVGWRKMSYTKSQCENAMKYLTKHTMIATKKTTRGLIITVLNYDKYQDVKNYKDTMSATQNDTREPQSSHTINNNDKNVKNINIYSSSSFLLDIPSKDLEQISTDIGVDKKDIILKGKELFDYCKSKGKQYKDYKAFLRNCVRKDKPKNQVNSLLKGTVNYEDIKSSL